MGSHSSVGWDDVLGRDMLWMLGVGVDCAQCYAFPGGGGTGLALQRLSVPVVQFWFYGAKLCPRCELQFSVWRGWLQDSFSEGARGSSGWKESKKPDPPRRAERSFISVGSSLRGSSQIVYFGPNEKHVSSTESPITRERCCGCMLGPAWGTQLLPAQAGDRGCCAWRTQGCDPCCFHGVPGVTARMVMSLLLCLGRNLRLCSCWLILA